MIRTPSWPSAAVAASASASASARAARKSSRPRRSRPSAGLELGGEPHQLAHVGEAGLARGPHQHREVVPGRGHRGVDQLGQAAGAGAARGAPPRSPRSRQQRALGRVDLVEPLGVVQLGLPAADERARPPARLAPRAPAAARSSQSVSGRRRRRRARRARRTGPGRRAGWRSSPAGRRRRRPAAGTSSRGRRRRRAAARPAPASPRRRRGG